MDEDVGPSDVAFDGFATTVARVKGMLLTSEDAERAVDLLAQVARDMVSSAVGAGASLIDEAGGRISAGTTDRIAATADELQYRTGIGPCISAWATSAVQRIDDTALDSRWPVWSAMVRDMGIRSVISAPMIFRGDCIGALKAYSGAASAFSHDDEKRLVLLAGAAATLLGAAQGSEGPARLSTALRSALDDRRSVDRATGIIMERHGLGHEEAGDRLLADSRISRQPLAVMARQLLMRAADDEL